jgi:hypothetical protein
MANISNIDFIKIGIDQNGVVHYVNASGAWDILPLGGGDCCTEGTPFVGFDVSDVVPRPIDGKVNFGITTSGNLATKGAVGVQQYFAPTGNVLIYESLLTQSSTNAPIPIVISNNTLATITFSYNNVGQYIVDSNLPIFSSENKVAMILNFKDNQYGYQLFYDSATRVKINTLNKVLAGALTNGILNNTYYKLIITP